MKQKRKFSLQQIALCSMFTAVIAILSQLSIPMPFGVPLTLQTAAVAMCGYLLGWKMGGLCVLLYLLLGTAGLPVFSNFRGGIGMLFGLTGGFLWGFLFLALLCGATRLHWKPLAVIGMGLAGLLICHLLGITQYALLTHSSFWGSAIRISVPYLPKDVVSVTASYFFAGLLQQRTAFFRLPGVRS